MSYILVIWTVVACSHSHCKSEWRQLIQVQTRALCEAAAKDLNIKTTEYRCIQVKQ